MRRLLTELVLVNRGARGVTAWAHAGLTVGCGALFFMFLLGRAGLDYVDRQILGAVPDHELTVGLKKKDVAFFQISDPAGKAALSPEDLEAIAALDGVRAVTPLTYGTEASAAEITFMGKTYNTDMIVQGFDPAWIGGDVAPEKLDWEPGQTVPVVLNSQILVIYNNGYAQSQGLPQLSAKAVMTPVWKLIYGTKKGVPVTLNAQIVGFSSKVALGAAIPRAALDYLHGARGLQPAPATEAVLALDAAADTDAVRRAIDELGYAVNEPHPLTRIFRQLHGVALVGLLLLTGCLVLFGLMFGGSGLATEASVAAIDYACRELDWDSVETHLDDDNEAARKLVLRLGGSVMLREVFPDGIERNVYSIPPSPVTSQTR